MTSLTYTTHMFVFLFLNAIDLSKAGCGNLLDPEKWAGNLTQTIALVRAKDLESSVKCTLEAELHGGREVARYLLLECLKKVTYDSPECQGKRSEEIHFIHFMCLVAKAHKATDTVTAEDTSHLFTACEYDTVCKMYSETASTHLTTTTATTTLPESTTTLPETTTTLPETTTTLPETAATSLPSSTKTGIATLKPTTTLVETATVLPSPPTTAATTLAEGQTKAQRNGDKQPDTKNTTDNLMIYLILSLVLNLFLLAAFFYVRHQRARDRMLWTSAQPTTNGNRANHMLQTEVPLQSDTPLSATNNNSETNLLIENPEEQTNL